MNTKIDLSSYFNRIGFKGQAKADLETLKQLHLLHTQSIPFENLNPLLKIPVEIDIESIQKKIIHEHRGGYCFEQNLLFCHYLQTIGFDARPLAARVVFNRSEQEITTKSHVLLLINLNGEKYIADAGFGGQSLTAPLAFKTNISQTTPHENYRILDREKYFLLQAFINKEWKNLYRFTLQERYFIDFKVANWYTSTHPSSHFTHALTAAIAGNNCRYTLKDNHFRIHYINKESESHFVKESDDLKKLLEETFKIKLPKVEHLDEVLSDICKKE